MQGILSALGAETCDCVQVMSDGNDGLRNFVQRAIRIPIEPQLDWFHIGMRLERLRKIVQLPVNYNEYRREPNAFDPMMRRVERVRHALWHGRVPSALDHLTALRQELNRWSTNHPDSARERRISTALFRWAGGASVFGAYDRFRGSGLTIETVASRFDEIMGGEPQGVIGHKGFDPSTWDIKGGVSGSMHHARKSFCRRFCVER